jgi:hypothetical protein
MDGQSHAWFGLKIFSGGFAENVILNKFIKLNTKDNL